VLAAAYLLAGIVSLQFSFYHPIVSTVWIPPGIALAAVLAFGPRILWGIAAGNVFLIPWNGVSIGAALPAEIVWQPLSATGC
jgi:hypothetical protein